MSRCRDAASASPFHSPLILFAALISIALLPTAQAIDWMSQHEILKDLTVYQSMVAATVGLLLWDSLISFPFEWHYYTRKRAWKHGMTAYIIVRYCTWIHLVSVLVNIHTTTKLDCEASMVILLVTLSLATLATSLIFVVRCIAVWKRNRYVTIALGLLWLATASIHLSSCARLKSVWTPQGCQSVFVRPLWEFNMAYVLTQVLDTVTFGLSAWVLRVMKKQGFVKVLFGQACVFIGITATLNSACMILVYLGPNPVMTYILSPLAVTVSGVLACKSFRDLQAHSLRTDTITCQSVPSWGGTVVKPLPSPGDSPPASSGVKEATQLKADSGLMQSKRRRTDWLTNSGLDDDDQSTIEMLAVQSPLPISSLSGYRTTQMSCHSLCCPLYAAHLAHHGPRLPPRSARITFGGSPLTEEEEENRLEGLIAMNSRGVYEHLRTTDCLGNTKAGVKMDESNGLATDCEDETSRPRISMAEATRGRSRSNTFGSGSGSASGEYCPHECCTPVFTSRGINTTTNCNKKGKSSPNLAASSNTTTTSTMTAVAESKSVAPAPRPGILRARIDDGCLSSHTKNKHHYHRGDADAIDNSAANNGRRLSDEPSDNSSQPSNRSEERGKGLTTQQRVTSEGEKAKEGRKIGGPATLTVALTSHREVQID